MPETEIGLDDVSESNWSGNLMQYNAKKKKKQMRRILLDLNLNAEYETLPEPEIGLDDVSESNWSGNFLQCNAKKKINTKSSSRFEFKC